MCAVECLTQSLDLLGLEGDQEGPQGDQEGPQGDQLGAAGEHFVEQSQSEGDREGDGTGPSEDMLVDEVTSEHLEVLALPSGTAQMGVVSSSVGGAAPSGGVALASEDIVSSSVGVVSSNGGVDLAEVTCDNENGHPTDPSLTTPTDEEVSRLWSEHYNGYYWYCYQMFCYEGEEGEGGVVVEGEEGMFEGVGEGNGEQTGNGEGEVGNEEGEMFDCVEEGNGEGALGSGEGEEGEMVEEEGAGNGGGMEEEGSLEGDVGREVVRELVSETVCGVVSELCTEALGSSAGPEQEGGVADGEGGVAEHGVGVAGQKRQAWSVSDEEQAERKR